MNDAISTLMCNSTPLVVVSGMETLALSTAATRFDNADELHTMPTINARKALRSELLAKIRGCTDGDELTGCLAQNLEKATRAREHMLIRGDIMNAFATRSKELSGRKLSKAEMESLFPTSSKKAASTPALPLSEFGITERLKSAHGHELMFVADTKQWYIYADGCWQYEKTAVRVIQKARAIVKTLRPMAEAVADDYVREQMLKKIELCERTAFARGAVAGLAGEDGIITDSIPILTFSASRTASLS
jgi:hypothetical protein